MASFTITRKNGRAYEVLVDDEDLERVLSAGKWFIWHENEKYTPYVWMHDRRDGKHTTVKLHRWLLSATAQTVDHRNGNGLDNRKENLRQATFEQNQHNRGRNQRGNSLKTNPYKGVSRHGQYPEFWVAQMSCKGKRVYLGCFRSPEEAHAAYCAGVATRGEFARTA